MVFKLSKKAHFLQFCSDLNKKPKSVKPIYIYMYLKGLVTHFQKIVFLIMLWLTVLEILELEVQDVVKFLQS